MTGHLYRRKKENEAKQLVTKVQRSMPRSNQLDSTDLGDLGGRLWKSTKAKCETHSGQWKLKLLFQKAFTMREEKISPPLLFNRLT